MKRETGQRARRTLRDVLVIALAALFLLMASGVADGLVPAKAEPLPARDFVPLVVPIPTDGVIDARVTWPLRPLDAPRATPTPRPARTPAPRPKPSPRPSVRLTGSRLVGTATWYCWPGYSGCMKIHPSGPYAAAGPKLREAIGGGDHCAPGPHCWRDRTVRICNGPGNCTTAILADWCRCPGDHVIDLYGDVMTLIDPGFVLNGGVSSAVISW